MNKICELNYEINVTRKPNEACLLYTSDAADE